MSNPAPRIAHLIVTIGLAGLAGGGCLVVPTTQTTTRALGTTQSDIIPGPIRRIVLEARLSEDTVSVIARTKGACERQVFEVTEVTSSKHARMGGTSDPRGALLALALAPLTLSVSALVTGLVVMADGGGTTTRESRLDRTIRFACTRAAAGLAVELAFPSGTTRQAITDDRGELSLAIPASEPDRGTVTVNAPGAVGRAVSYERAPSQESLLRGKVAACAAAHGVSGALKLRVATDEDGLPRRLGVDAGDGRFAACVSTAVQQVRFARTQNGGLRVFAFELPAIPPGAAPTASMP